MIGGVDASFVARTFASAPTQGASRAQKSDAASSGELSEEQKKQVEKLKKRDQEVRAHEQAHVAAGGNLIRGGVNFKYETGPDGQRYAVGGDVSIDVSKARTPQETVRKAEQIRNAAMAPSDPSAQDYSVAAQAGRLAAKAQAEMAQNTQESQTKAAGISSAAASAVKAYQAAEEAFSAVAGNLIAARA
ncbi:putative metalloprotease CJM1_0395 family protein [Niveibacterium microcysteis]|uniref:SprA-related family protein n=1 Tax=Niveibacterium microcysteis TaxID=2811415 RepID=A0ABX7M000_9RHOO|nr:putative metalloprotease CJM1_0395 family protein [Niveibacterium microcysteis]QSI75090.1 hypothetical protein JY500_11155 [Niveibacterium microcysteis]